MHQRRGIGTAVLQLVADQCREWGDTELMISWVPGIGSPEDLYRKFGFVLTGEVSDGEVEARLTLDD